MSETDQTKSIRFKTEMRLASADDKGELKKIWKLCFGDDDRYLDLYFDNRNWIEETAVLLVDSVIVSMLAMIPADVVREDGSRLSSAMIYAVATHPEFRKKGFADELMSFCNESLKERHISSTFLVPAGEDLFRFYANRGYREAFYTSQTELTGKDVKIMEVPDRLSLKFKTAEPDEYNAARRNFLAGSVFVDYRDEEILHQKRVSMQEGTDIYLIMRNEADGPEGSGHVIGCAAVEKGQDFVVIKELLADEQYLAPAIKLISDRAPADRYIVRTPAFSGKPLGSAVSAFGMLRINGEEASLPDGCRAYLGIAFD